MPRLTKEQIAELWSHLTADEICVLHHLAKPGATVQKVAFATFGFREGRTGETSEEYNNRLTIAISRVQKITRSLEEKLGGDPGAVYRAFWAHHKNARVRGKTNPKEDVPISEDFLEDIDLEEVREKYRALDARHKHKADSVATKVFPSRGGVAAWRPRKNFHLMDMLGISDLSSKEQAVVLQKVLEAEGAASGA